MPPNQGFVEEGSDAPKDILEKTTKLRLRIDGHWYDLSAWQHMHPGGAAILQHLHNEDATDAFYSLHSKEAVARLRKMHKTPMTDEDCSSSKIAVNFRKLRKELEDEGWFVRNPLWDAFYVGAVFFLIAVGIAIVHEHSFLATILIGVAMEQAGWLGHDYVHGRGTQSWYLGRFLGGVVNGFSSRWWSQKHNTHHVYTNTFGVDDDIANDPVFHLWIPEEDKDHPLRRYQHWYFFPVCSLLYTSWRLQSLQHLWKHPELGEALTLALGYGWMALFLPWYVAVGSVLVGGLLVGIVVTASHQSEEMFEGERPYDFVRDQFLSTRDAESWNPVLNWLWGGMQYQLEHHLFPTMPKYRYSALTYRVKKFAKQNGLEYKVDGMWGILARNFDTMRKFALSDSKSKSS